MSKSAPDTRNRIDTQSNLVPKKKKPNRKEKKAALKELRDVIDPLPMKLSKEKKETNGEKFKRINKYSKSMKRNLQKHGLSVAAYSDALNEYRGIRRKRKVAEKKIRKDKHMKALAGRKSKASKNAPNKKAA